MTNNLSRGSTAHAAIESCRGTLATGLITVAKALSVDSSLCLNVCACPLNSLEVIWRDSTVYKTSTTVPGFVSSVHGPLVRQNLCGTTSLKTLRQLWGLGESLGLRQWFQGGYTGRLALQEGQIQQSCCGARRSASPWAGPSKWNRHALATRHFWWLSSAQLQLRAN